MESQDYYRCSKCPIIGPARELETHLAEHHLDYRPHHCHTCGRRAYDRAVIADECGARRHNVALWQAREEVKERQLAADLKKCLNLPVAVTELKVTLQSDAVTVAALPDGPDSGIFAADSSSVAQEENNGHSGMPADDCSTSVTLADNSDEAIETDSAEGTTAMGAASSSTSRPKKRRHDATVHTVMTCRYTGCGEKVVLSGTVDFRDKQKRHVQERHLPRPSQNIHCPMVGCVWAAGKKHFSYMQTLCAHMKKRHGGVNALNVEQRAAYRATQKRVLDATYELIPTCFPPGAVTRNDAAAKRTCRCAKCGETVSALQRALRQGQRGHIETRHMEAGPKISCPMEGCGKTWDTLVNLEGHIARCHGGLSCLNVKQRAEHHALKKRRNAAIGVIFADHFPDDG